MIQPLRDLIYIIPIEPRLDEGRLIQVPEMYDKVYEDPYGKAPSRIIIPRTTRQKPTQGIVKYRGPLTTGEVRRGDHVIFSPLDGYEIVDEFEGRLIIIAEEDILMTLTSDEDNTYFLREDVKRIVRMLARDIAQKANNEADKKAALKIGDIFEERLDSHFAEELYF